MVFFLENMTFVFVFALLVVGCNSDAPPTTAPVSTQPERVYCGDIPNNLFTCLGSPKIINRATVSKCGADTDDCSKINCIFRESGWLNEGAVDKAKIKESFDQFASEHPVWSDAVTRLKANCFEHTLPVQGVFLNCPSYDVMHCIQHSFLRYAPASQWSSKQECTYPRSYAEHCPLCPQDCFAPRVPYGSCNACLVLPRSP